MDKVYSFKSNAKRDVLKAIKAGTAPGKNYEIKKKGPREYKIVWNDDAPKMPRADTKSAQVIALLQRPEGATVPEIQAVTGWAPHTTRAQVSTSCRKLGLTVSTEKVEGRGRVYRAAS